VTSHGIRSQLGVLVAHRRFDVPHLFYGSAPRRQHPGHRHHTGSDRQSNERHPKERRPTHDGRDPNTCRQRPNTCRAPNHPDISQVPEILVDSFEERPAAPTVPVYVSRCDLTGHLGGFGDLLGERTLQTGGEI
jgi:hypothetical protein